MERVSASLIEEIRSALVERYNRDQEIQQMIEEIGAEEGLNEKELFVIHQAYLEVKERMQYTANLMELWNQIEAVQDRMSACLILMKAWNAIYLAMFFPLINRWAMVRPTKIIWTMQWSKLSCTI